MKGLKPSTLLPSPMMQIKFKLPPALKRKLFYNSSVNFAILPVYIQPIFKATFTHNPSIPHTSEWDYNKCSICNQVFNTSTFFKSHIIELHNFSDNSNICRKCFEPNEVYTYRPEPYMAISMSCKTCELL